MNKIMLYTSVLLFCVHNATAQKRIIPTTEQTERVLRTTTNIVIGGNNIILDAALQKSVETRWHITPFVFINSEEFIQYSSDANRTFLLLVGGTFKGDASQNGYTFLNFLMGGGQTPDKLSDFILLPVACKGNDEDIAITFMDAFVDIVQQHLQKLQAKPSLVRLELDSYNSNMDVLTERSLMLAKEDINTDFNEIEFRLFNGHLQITDRANITSAMDSAIANIVVGLTLSPTDETLKVPYCYNMLITSDTHELIYFKRHKVNKANQLGFLKEEIKRFSLPFRIKK